MNTSRRILCGGSGCSKFISDRASRVARGACLEEADGKVQYLRKIGKKYERDNCADDLPMP